MALRDNSFPSSDNRRFLLGTVAGEPNAKYHLADVGPWGMASLYGPIEYRPSGSGLGVAPCSPDRSLSDRLAHAAVEG